MVATAAALLSPNCTNEISFALKPRLHWRFGPRENVRRFGRTYIAFSLTKRHLNYPFLMIDKL